jgi:hypothetical protein
MRLLGRNPYGSLTRDGTSLTGSSRSPSYRGGASTERGSAVVDAGMIVLTAVAFGVLFGLVKWLERV